MSDGVSGSAEMAKKITAPALVQEQPAIGRLHLHLPTARVVFTRLLIFPEPIISEIGSAETL